MGLFTDILNDPISELDRRIRLLERQARIPELREELAITVSDDLMKAAATEANERTGNWINEDDAAAFARIVVDVINRTRS